MTRPETPMSDMERTMFNYWLDQYERISGEIAPPEVAKVFSLLCRLDDDELEVPIGPDEE